jgi:HK97 family phage prohead protease
VTTDRRTLFIADARLQVIPPVAGKPVTLAGYAIVFNVLSSDRGGYKVRLMPGSAKFAPEVHALWHHEYRDVLATNRNGTLRIFEDGVGVRVEIDLPDTSAGRDVAELVRTGRVRGMSFGMVDSPKGEEVTENGEKILNARDYVVDEVTVTAIPAFAQATIGIKDEDGSGSPRIGYAARDAQSREVQTLRFKNIRLPAGRVSATGAVLTR